MTHTHAKCQGQRSLTSNVRVKTNEKMKATTLPPVITRSVNITYF